MQVYSNVEYGYKIKVPAWWKVREATGVAGAEIANSSRTTICSIFGLPNEKIDEQGESELPD